MKSIRLISGILAFAIIIASLALLSANATTEDSVWIDRNLKSEVTHQEIYDESKDYGAYKPSLCEKQTFFTKKLSLLDIITKNDTVTTYCALRLNTSDYVAGKYLKKSDTRIAGQLVTTGDNYKVAAGGDVAFVPYKTSSTSTKVYVRMINDFSQQQTPRFNLVTGRLQYETEYSPDQLIKDVRSKSIRWLGGHFIPTAFPNHVIIDQLNGSIVRIDRTTNEAIMFGRGSFTASGQSAREKVIKLSPSGRYALVGEQKTGKAYLYDLEHCVDSPTFNSTDFRYKDSMDCDFVDIGVFIATEYNENRIIPLESLKFNNERQLTVSFSSTDLENNKIYYVIRIVPEGTEFTDPPTYIAMGDSFASGEGDMDDSWYELGTNAPENKCHLSKRSYPYLLAEQLELDEFHSVACSGAKIKDIINESQKDIEKTPPNNIGKWFPGINMQKEYLSGAIQPKTITLSIGGNDVGFADKLKECVIGPGTCKYAEDSEFRSHVAMEITAMYDKLVETYNEIIDITEENTKIFVVGYPQFVKATGGNCGLNVHMNDEERLFINQATSYMNRIIEAATIETGVHYLDVETALEGKNLCSIVDDSQMAVNGLTEGDDTRIPREIALLNPLFSQFTTFGVGAESYHPNQNGHILLQRRISELAQGDITMFNTCENNELICSLGTRNIPIPNVAYWGETAMNYALSYDANLAQELPDYPRNLTMITGDTFSNIIRQFSLKIEGLLPFSEVSFQLHSDPIDLGTYHSDENGTLVIDLEIPKNIEPGSHTLDAFTTNIIGEPVHYYQHLLAYDESNSDRDCTFVEPSGVDVDNDGIDDACDGFYEYAEVSEEETTKSSQVVAVNTEIFSTNDEDIQITSEEQPSTIYLSPVATNEPQQTTSSGATLGAIESSNEPIVNDDIASAYTNPTLWVVMAGMTVVGASIVTYRFFSR